MSRTSRRNAMVTAAAMLALVLAGPAQSATSAPLPPPTPDTGGWYLQLGDSLAAGYQPGTGDDPTGGYADNVLAAINRRAPGTTLVNLACSGETTTTMTDGGKCPYELVDQLDQALAFLREHAGKTRAITLSLGANDVLPRLRGGCTEVDCLGIDLVQENLTEILGELRQAAPRVKIVVLNNYNPILALWHTSPEGTALALASIPLQAALNEAIGAAASTVGARVADISTRFHSQARNVSSSARYICAWTWMCSMNDIHANTTGYDVMGGVVAATLYSPRPRALAAGR